MSENKLPDLRLYIEYIDVQIHIRATSDEGTVNSLMLASALMSEARRQGYPNPKVKMQLKKVKGKES